MINIGKIGLRKKMQVSARVAVNIPKNFGINQERVDVTIDGFITNLDGKFLLEACGTCCVSLDCNLCLTPVELRLDFDIVETYVDETEATEEEHITFTDKIIDLTPAAERNLFINIPMRSVCSADCAGLCPKCGKNLNKGQCNCDAGINEHFRELLSIDFD